MGMSTLIVQISTGLGLYIIYLTFLALRRRFKNARFSREHGCLPPSKAPTDWTFNISRPFILSKVRKAHKFMPTQQESFYRNGNTFAFSIAGKRLIMTCEPENMKAILATQFKDFELGKLRHDNWGEVLGEGIFTVDGHRWEHSRAMLKPQFNKNQITDLEDLETHVQNLFSRLSFAENGGNVLNLHEYFLNFTLDFSTAFLFGKSVDSQLCQGQTSKFAQDLDYAQKVISFRVSLENFWWLYRPKKFTKAVADVQAFIGESVQQALDKQKSEKGKTSEKYVFLEALARETQDPVVLRDQMMNILVAGRDTTAGFLSWIVYSLARNPRVWDILRREILTDFGRDTPTYQQLKDTKYLKWVLNEVLRLYPLVPTNFRYANKNTTLPLGGGPDGLSPIFIEKGERCVYSVYSAHRRKDIYGEDADIFRPERWGEGKPRGWEFLPFNGGPRICLGQQLALTVASYVIVRMVQNFERIENADTNKEELGDLTLTFMPYPGTLVRLFKDPEA
ncbi:uncharacterized protein H6S33_011186 [Morchella sextelata]|uniref:uncharacterized protein n=1 Tax=Morchella sextelata TaxID=1174677 RepID=UPI001D03F9DA|nr:uncharacterized protein H6S33_011186 [Morchella sextelata]KAH0610759.1 hypothetical protein H6S33_011186 [Morchella sextelata]